MKRNKQKNKENNGDEPLLEFTQEEVHSSSFRLDSATALDVSQRKALEDEDKKLDAISTTTGTSKALSGSNEINSLLMSFVSDQTSMNTLFFPKEAVTVSTNTTHRLSSSSSIHGSNHEDNNNPFSEGRQNKKGATTCIGSGSSFMNSSLLTTTNSSFPASSSITSSDDNQDACSINSSSSEVEKPLSSFLSNNKRAEMNTTGNSSLLAQYEKNEEIFYQGEPPSSRNTTPIIQKELLQRQTLHSCSASVIEEEMDEQWYNELEPIQGPRQDEEYYLSTIQDMNELFLKEIKTGGSYMNDLGQDFNDILEACMTGDAP
ncbi:predicted protein [Chaetoceros tenuissimus]|uniref:Uncharacterized protein n=1 Tax=Chaetoceros tenuissimus TaxID=426638 RepID=A0AAD3D314_9STRA|nr:predicted protein [Chaetoceros tenuissimus]